MLKIGQMSKRQKKKKKGKCKNANNKAKNKANGMVIVMKQMGQLEHRNKRSVQYIQRGII
jgi:hypothetical protein